MRDYGKIHNGFWTGETLKGLSGDAKLLAAYLLSSPHTNMIGCFRLPDAYACDDLEWTSERLRNGFETLSQAGFVRYDARTKWVWIVNFLSFNKPENPNQWKAAAKLTASIPDSVAFKEDVCETVRKPFLNIPVPAPVPVPVLKEGVQGEETPTDTPDCPHDEIIALYHELLPASPRVRQWTDTRRTHLRARWREDRKRQDLAYWRRFFVHVAASAFLTGQVCGQGGRPFFAALDWLVKPENFAKVIEGKYHDRSAA